MDIKESLNNLLGNDLNLKLDTIIELTTIQLKNKLKIDLNEDIPKKFEYILVDISMKRFNRISNEGVVTEKIGEVSITYILPEKDFNEYSFEINEYLKENGNEKYKLGAIYIK